MLKTVPISVGKVMHFYQDSLKVQRRRKEKKTPQTLERFSVYLYFI